MPKVSVPALALVALTSVPAAAQDTDQQFIAAFEAPLPSAVADTAFAQQFGLWPQATH